MDIISIIKKKCQKEELTKDEMTFFIKCIVNGSIDQCQIGKSLVLII
jgi:thymidine phosphorylase